MCINKVLNNEVILLVDCPEEHLSPQWIEKFARLLIILYKKNGVEIRVASYSPELAEAIQNIAKKETVINDVSSYQEACGEKTSPNGTADFVGFKYIKIIISHFKNKGITY